MVTCDILRRAPQLPPASLGAAALLLCCVLCSPHARAGGLTPAPASALDLSLAGGGIALAEGAAALWLNPAAVDGASFGATLTLSMASDDRTLVRDGSVVNQPLPEARDGEGARLAPAFALSYPLVRQRLWLSLGYHQALRHESRFLPPDSPDVEEAARYLGRSMSITDHRVVLGAALGVGMLRVGVAIEAGYTRLQHVRALWAGLDADSPQLERNLYDSEATLALDGPSFAARIGLALRPWRWLRLALAFALPGVRRLEGSIGLGQPQMTPSGFTSIVARGGRAELDLDPPPGIDAGVALDACSRLTFVAALRWRRWSSLETPRARVTEAGYDLSGAAPRTIEVESVGLGFRLRDALSVHGGAELRLLDGFVRLRLGYAYQRGTTPPRAPSSVLLDPPRHTIAGGIEVRAGYLAVAAGLSHSFGAQLLSEGDGTVLENPLDPDVTRDIGRGRYQASSTRVVLEIRLAL